MHFRLLLPTFFTFTFTFTFSINRALYKANLPSQFDMDQLLDKEKFIINSIPFNISEKGIIGFINEDLEFKWAMDIYASTSQYEEHEVAPKFSFTQLAQAEDFIFNESFVWKNASSYDDTVDDWVGDFYIFDAHSFDCEIKLNRLSNFEFHIHIKGKVNLNWATAEEEHLVDFEIIQPIPFNGIMCEVDDEQKCKMALEPFINTNGFKWHSVADNPEWDDSWFLPEKE